MYARAFPLLLVLVACDTRLCRDPDAWVPVEYVAPKTSYPPVIDGRLDDAAWQSAPWTEPFRRSNRRGRPRQLTRAKLLWDDAHLYVAFEVEDDDIVAPHDQDDAPLYESEVVEIFIDADSDGATYDEIEVSPGNRLFDARFRRRRKGMDLAWSSGTRHAVQVDGTVNVRGDRDRGWTAELAIPLDRLSSVPRLPPQPGDRWRMNLYRLDHHPGIQGQAFSPVLTGDFHHLPRFGTLVFGR